MYIVICFFGFCHDHSHKRSESTYDPVCFWQRRIEEYLLSFDIFIKFIFSSGAEIKCESDELRRVLTQNCGSFIEESVDLLIGDMYLLTVGRQK